MIHARRAQRDGGGQGGHRAAIGVFGLAILAFGGATARGQCEQDKLLAANGATGDYFGVAVAVEGDLAIVGAPQDDHAASNCGSAGAFRFDGTNWVQDPTLLLAADADEGDFFGFAVAIDGDVAVIGAWGDDEKGTNAGAAYVFRDDGAAWVYETKLTAADGQSGDEFGRSVAVRDGLALIGAPGLDGPGAAYVFRYDGPSGWSEEAKLVQPDGEPGDALGSATAIGEDFALVGAHHDADFGYDSGSVYVFTRYGAIWAFQSKLNPTDAGPGDQFGFSIAMDEEVAVIGARRDDHTAYRAGSAYVFRLEAPWWVEETKLLASGGDAQEEFGYAVDILGDVALIGARWDDDNGYHAGSAYVFRKEASAWMEAPKLLAPDGAMNDRFGLAVSLTAGHALIGAWGDDDHGDESGSAYAFDLLGEDCNANGVCDQRDIADGTSPDVNGNGIPDECEACPADVNGDGTVDVVDLLLLLATWGPCSPMGDCLGDIDASGEVDVLDLLALLADWGPCL